MVGLPHFIWLPDRRQSAFDPMAFSAGSSPTATRSYTSTSFKVQAIDSITKLVARPAVRRPFGVPHPKTASKRCRKTSSKQGRTRVRAGSGRP